MEEILRADDGLDHLFEMAGLYSKETGLPFYVWISPRAGARHDIRVKCSTSHKYDPENEAIVGVQPDIHVIKGKMSTANLRILTQWIELNYATIVDFWNEEINDPEMRARIEPLV